MVRRKKEQEERRRKETEALAAAAALAAIQFEKQQLEDSKNDFTPIVSPDVKGKHNRSKNIIQTNDSITVRSNKKALMYDFNQENAMSNRERLNKSLQKRQNNLNTCEKETEKK